MSSDTQTLRAPIADWFDPKEAMVDPYPLYERLRELAPVVYAPAVERYFLTTHAAVTYAEQHPLEFSSHAEQNVTMIRALGGRPMLRKDDPDHSVDRSAINPTLRPKAISNTWSPLFEQNVDTWLDYIVDMGPNKADINRDFAAPVASKNLIDILGFPADTPVDDMRRWSTDYIAGIGNLLDDEDIWRRCEASQNEVNSILDDLLPYLRRNPNSSIVSHLLEVGLPEDVVRANIHLTISGGMNEPQHMITNIVWALSTHASQLTDVLSGDVSWGDVFEETVRWQSPIGMIPRELREDTEVEGIHLPMGSNLGLLLASANRDDAVFPHANQFDVHRRSRGHLGFGSGIHMCAGRWAAKDAISVHALPKLYERLPQLQIDADRPLTWDGWVFRGVTALPCTW